MADFCSQCYKELFAGLPGNDFDYLEKQGRGYYDVICEGCGFIEVNEKGECTGNGCMEKHKEPEYKK